MASSPDPGSEDAPPPKRQATLGEVIKAVAWSFFGVRKRQHMLSDAVTIRPYQVVIVGILMGAAFVVTLLIIVRIVLKLAAP